MTIGTGRNRNDVVTFYMENRSAMSSRVFINELKKHFPHKNSQILVTGSIRPYNGETLNIFGLKKNIEETLQGIGKIFYDRFSIAESKTGDLVFTGSAPNGTRIRIRLRKVTKQGIAEFKALMARDGGAFDKEQAARIMTRKANSAHIKVKAHYMQNYKSDVDAILDDFIAYSDECIASGGVVPAHSLVS